jgi:hypothetical protein
VSEIETRNEDDPAGEPRPESKSAERMPADGAPSVEPYEPPKLVKFERLSKLIVSGE